MTFNKMASTEVRYIGEGSVVEEVLERYQYFNIEIYSVKSPRFIILSYLLNPFHPEND